MCLADLHNATVARWFTGVLLTGALLQRPGDLQYPSTEDKRFTGSWHTDTLLPRPGDLHVPGTLTYCYCCQVINRCLTQRYMYTFVYTATEIKLSTDARPTKTLLQKPSYFQFPGTQSHYRDHVIYRWLAHWHTATEARWNTGRGGTYPELIRPGRF